MKSLKNVLIDARVVPSPADDLCLAFANTRYWRGSEAPTEGLSNFTDLLTWCEQAKLLHPSHKFRGWCANNAGATASLFDAAITARELVYSVFLAIADGGGCSVKDLRALNRLLAEAPPRSQLARQGPACGWRLPAAKPALEQVLAPVLWSASDLLTGARRARVRCCANDKCRWLFLDDSKSGTRRWCAMSACGNRAKAHRHYLKTREGKVPLALVGRG
jgi:predicted RNA-binding Zn ribbon-like protein